MSDKIEIDLALPIKDDVGKEIKIVDKESVSITGTGRIIGVDSNALNAGKILSFGIALCNILSYKTAPKSLEDAAKIKRWHAKIYNEMAQSKPNILLNSDELKEIKDIISAATPEKLNVIVDGTIYDMITDYVELAIKAKTQ